MLIKVLLTAVFVFTYFANVFSQDAIKVMTFNIRCANCEKPEDVNHWSKRKILAGEIISKYNPDVIGLQEAEHFALNDLIELVPVYKWTGVGREDGDQKGEHSAIMFKEDKLELLEEKTLWLSETPSKVSKGWDAAYHRTLTFALFKKNETGEQFYFINTHFDHLGDTARIESAKLITALADSLRQNHPVIFCGDFNFTMQAEGYKIIAERFSDAHIKTGSKDGITFQAFGKNPSGNNRIDFIFTGKDAAVSDYKIITDMPGGNYPSDHYPVIASIKFK